MLLAIDIGNTNIVFAVFNSDIIVGKWRMSTYTARTEDEYAVMLTTMMENSTISRQDINNIIISSVVPQNLFTIQQLCRKFFNCEAKIVDNSNINIDIQLDSPAEVGADRLVNAVAAFSKYKKSSIVIDFGTATTFDVIDDKGAYLGGAIAPGINLSLKALHTASAKLPEISIKKPKNIIGKSTVTAIESGIYFGYIGLVEGIVSRMEQEVSAKIIIATGGLAPLFINAVDKIKYIEEDLTLHGLNIIHKEAIYNE